MMIGERCHPFKADLVCRGRYDAVMRGVFGWDQNVGGFVCEDLLVRTRTAPKDSASRWRRIYYDIEDHTGEPWALERCPYCGFPLPEYPNQTTDPYEGRNIEAELGIERLPKLPKRGEMDVTDGQGDGC